MKQKKHKGDPKMCSPLSCSAGDGAKGRGSKKVQKLCEDTVNLLNSLQ